MLKIKLEGHKEVFEIMQQLTETMQKQILKSAIRSAARPMVNSAKERAPSDSGSLKEMIRIVAYKRVARKSEVAMAIKHVFGRNKKAGTVNEYYGKFVHEGTDQRTPRKKGKVLAFKDKSGKMIFARSVKGIKAKPYLEKAYDQEVANVEKRFGDNLQKSVERFVSRKFKLTR